MAIQFSFTNGDITYPAAYGRVERFSGSKTEINACLSIYSSEAKKGATPVATANMHAPLDINSEDNIFVQAYTAIKAEEWIGESLDV